MNVRATERTASGEWCFTYCFIYHHFQQKHLLNFEFETTFQEDSSGLSDVNIDQNIGFIVSSQSIGKSPPCSSYFSQNLWHSEFVYIVRALVVYTVCIPCTSKMDRELTTSRDAPLYSFRI